MEQKSFKCDYYSKRNDNSIIKQANKVRPMQVKVTDIERDNKGCVTITLKRVN